MRPSCFRFASLALLLSCVWSVPVLGQAKKVKQTLPNAWVKAFQWRCIGPANMSGRITSIAVNEKDPSMWWAATASGGLLKTVNNGTSFEHQFDHQAVVSIGDVQVARSNPKIVWVGSGESNPRNSVSWGDGVYKSVDGGKSWKNMGLRKSFQIGRIAIHPTNPDIVYVGVLGRLWGPSKERGLYKTTNGGKSWKRVLFVDDKTGIIDIQMHPSEPATLLVAAYERQRDGFDGNDPGKKHGKGSGLYRTTDGGKTFDRMTKGLPTCNLGRIGLCYYRADPKFVYAVVESAKIGQEPANAAYLGMIGQNAEVGSKITRVVAKSPASKAGLKVGDIVTQIGKKKVFSYNDLLREIRGHVAGQKTQLHVVRNRKSVVLKVQLGNRPKPQPRQGKKQRGKKKRRRRPQPTRSPFGTRLGGQQANFQDHQGKQGHQFGGVYRSSDGGKSWTRINSVNPRPMYYSQIRVDPSDKNRIFLLGTRLFKSTDGGKTFTPNGAGRGVHVDHHAMWIDPGDGRHIILGNDGGIYTTHDRGANWDHLNHVAIGQFYHVGIGPRRNYRVYGGMQDNGSWGGPSRVSNGRGAINSDWFRVGSGDGFICLVDPQDPDQIFFESQNGFMGRVNLRTGRRGFIRPPRRRGTRYRFNWKTPFILSRHNSKVHYSAGNVVFRSMNQGSRLKVISGDITRTNRGAGSAITESPVDEYVLYVGTTDGALSVTRDGGKQWTTLYGQRTRGRRSSGTGAKPTKEDPDKAKPKRPADALTGRWLGRMVVGGGQVRSFTLNLKLGKDGKEISGNYASEFVQGDIEKGQFDAKGKKASMDVGGPRGTIRFAAEYSPNQLKGTINVAGANLKVQFTARRQGVAITAKDGSKSLSLLMPGPRWVSSLEASRFSPGRCYVTFDGHRSDDDTPLVFATENYGETWRSIRANLPTSAGTTRVIREDVANQNLLYLGTEFGCWVSVDRGQSWTRLNNNLPTVAIHEIAVHPLAGEIVVATHGRSIWVVDVSALRSISTKTVQSPSTLYAPHSAIIWRRAPSRGGTTRQFVGQNPASGAAIYYSLTKTARVAKLQIKDHQGRLLRELNGPTTSGLHLVRWDLRGSLSTNNGQRRRPSRLVAPGQYQVCLIVDGETQQQSLSVQSDPADPNAARVIAETELWEAFFQKQKKGKVEPIDQ